MNLQKLSSLAATLALLVGAGLLAIVGREPPAFLLACEVAFFTLLGAVAGFIWKLPRLPWWASSRPVAGAVLICLGIGAIYVPAQLIVSALLLGAGSRLLWITEATPQPEVTVSLSGQPQVPAVIEKGGVACRTPDTNTPSRRWR